jgi:FMN phosphatase YigB (HAD superfamily)
VTTLGRGPGECLFVDDRPENVAGAARAGLPALRFVDAATLRRDLRARGVPGA